MENVLKELKEQQEIWVSKDTRKVNNRSEDTVPRRILEDIENNGITSEQLTVLGKSFPVFYYKGQITIHGVFPASMGGYSHGYKNLIVNQNKSLGIKYSAVDAKKKVRMAKLCKGGNVGSYRSSSEFYLYRAFRDNDAERMTKEILLGLYKTATEWSSTINKELFTGAVTIGHDPMTWTVYACVHINCIPETNVNAVVENLTGMDITKLQDILTEKEEAYKKYCEEIDQRNAENEKRRNAEFETKVKDDTREAFDIAALAKGEGCIVEVMTTSYGAGFYAVWKDGKSGQARAYHVERYAAASHEINTRKRMEAPLRLWAKPGYLVKIHRKGLK